MNIQAQAAILFEAAAVLKESVLPRRNARGEVNGNAVQGWLTRYANRLLKEGATDTRYEGMLLLEDLRRSTERGMKAGG